MCRCLGCHKRLQTCGRIRQRRHWATRYKAAAELGHAGHREWRHRDPSRYGPDQAEHRDNAVQPVLHIRWLIDRDGHTLARASEKLDAASGGEHCGGCGGGHAMGGRRFSTRTCRASQTGSDIRLATLSDDMLRPLDGYIGSIAFSLSGTTIAATSPRGSILDTYNANDMALATRTTLADVCGIAPNTQGFTLTTGTGVLGFQDGKQQTLKPPTPQAWDNHLIVV